MKNVNWMLAALLAVTLCTPLMAQNTKNLDAKLQRQIQVQQKKHRQAAKCRWCGTQITDLSGRCPADPDVYCMPEPNPSQKTCYRCGQNFTRGQKCQETQYHRFCAENYRQGEVIKREQNFISKEDRAARKAAKQAKKAQQKQQSRDESRYCPKCGEEYDIDVLYHGVQHKCTEPYSEPEAGAYWIESPASDAWDAADGEPHSNLVSVSSLQEESASGEPEMHYLQELDEDIAVKAETLLQKDRDAHNGYPEHSFEYYYHQVYAQSNAQPRHTEKCRWCGKTITSNSSRCSADPDVYCTPAPKMGSAVGVQPNTGNTISTTKEEICCPKCGEEYDIDVRYHGVQHRCEKAEKPVKYHPAEK